MSETCVVPGCENIAPEDSDHQLQISLRGVLYAGFGCDRCLDKFAAHNHDLLNVLVDRAISGERSRLVGKSIHAVMREDLRDAVAKGYMEENAIPGLYSRGQLSMRGIAAHKALAQQGLVPCRLPEERHAVQGRHRQRVPAHA